MFTVFKILIYVWSLNSPKYPRFNLKVSASRSLKYLRPILVERLSLLCSIMCGNSSHTLLYTQSNSILHVVLGDLFQGVVIPTMTCPFWLHRTLLQSSPRPLSSKMLSGVYLSPHCWVKWLLAHLVLGGSQASLWSLSWKSCAQRHYWF